MNTHVNFEISKLLKEKGYDETTQLIYMTNHTSEVLFENINGLKHSDGNNPFCSAPTIAEAVMWLYEKHNIWIYVWKSDINMTFTLWLQLLNVRGSSPIKVPLLKIFHTPTEAYEAAITYVLSNLI